MQQSLTVYEESRRARFQFIAALLASVVLIPTLIAGIFGANFDVPASKDPAGFPVFLAVLFTLAVIAFVTLWMAQSQDWSPRRRSYVVPALVALAIVVAFAIYLIRSDAGAGEPQEVAAGAAQTTNLPSSCITVPSTSSLPPRRRSQTRSVCTAESLTPPDSG